MGSYSVDEERQKLWIETPCLPSPPLSRAAGCNVFLKLENLQPSGSFKSRGIGNLMYRAMLSSAAERVHFYCPSGGNAGLGCATAAVALGQACTIVVPVNTKAHMVAKLRELGATVQQAGDNIAEADEYLRSTLLGDDPAGIYVPPFDHPHIWEGASTIVAELAHQLDGQPDAIVCNCGGGGLLNGIMDGLERAPWPAERPPQVLAVETVGADSLNACVRAGAHVALPAITSIATSLGCVKVSRRTWEWSQAKNVRSVTVTDAEAATGSVRFANDTRFLVEVACGASIAVFYNGLLRQTLGQGLTDAEWSKKKVVVIVCGGSNVTLDILRDYQQQYCIE